ncbi:MAG: hypothetical protein IKT45_06845 [Lachnospiraceae bacterium]|nr:hypothetical protein [Lachnospiraceae bacterium]
MKKIVRKFSVFANVLVLAVLAFFCCLSTVIVSTSFEEVIGAVLLDRNLRVMSIGIIVGLMFMISFLRFLFLFVYRTLNRIKYSGDATFANIDECYRCVGNGQLYYDRGIQTINLYYTDGGDISQLVKKREGEKLINRKEYLEVQLKFLDEYLQNIFGIGQSAIAALLLEISNNKSNYVWTILMLFFVILLIVSMPLVKHSKIISDCRKYEKAFLKHEIEAVSKLIVEYNAQLIISKDKELEFITQGAAIYELKKRMKKVRWKEEKDKVQKDISCIESMNLMEYDVLKSYKVPIRIGDRVGCLVYKKEEGLSNNYIGNENLINADYSKLYEILKAYNLLSYEDAHV